MNIVSLIVVFKSRYHDESLYYDSKLTHMARLYYRNLLSIWPFQPVVHPYPFFNVGYVSIIFE